MIARPTHIFSYSMKETKKNLKQKWNEWNSEEKLHNSALSGKKKGFLVEILLTMKLSFQSIKSTFPRVYCDSKIFGIDIFLYF